MCRFPCDDASALRRPASLFALGLAWVLLRSGAGMALDLLGMRRFAEGPVTGRRRVRAGKGVHYTASVAGVAVAPNREAFDALREGARVRVEYGRFERTVYRVWR